MKKLILKSVNKYDKEIKRFFNGTLLILIISGLIYIISQSIYNLYGLHLFHTSPPVSLKLETAGSNIMERTYSLGREKGIFIGYSPHTPLWERNAQYDPQDQYLQLNTLIEYQGQNFPVYKSVGADGVQIAVEDPSRPSRLAYYADLDYWVHETMYFDQNGVYKICRRYGTTIIDSYATVVYMDTLP